MMCAASSRCLLRYLPMRNEPTDRSSAIAPIDVALRSTAILGALSAAFGFVIVVAFGYFNRMHRFRPYFIGGGAVLWFVPGVLLLTCSRYIAHRRSAAAWGAMIIVILQAIAAAVLTVFFCTHTPISPVPIVMCLAWLAALIDTAIRLRRAARDIATDVEHRGAFSIVRSQPQRALTVDETREH